MTSRSMPTSKSADPSAIPSTFPVIFAPSRAFGDGGICSIKSFNQWSVSGISYQDLPFHIITEGSRDMTGMSGEKSFDLSWRRIHEFSIFLWTKQHLTDLMGRENSQTSEELYIIIYISNIIMPSLFGGDHELWNKNANIKTHYGGVHLFYRNPCYFRCVHLLCNTCQEAPLR